MASGPTCVGKGARDYGRLTMQISSFRDRVLSIVRKIPQGDVLTYKGVARLAGTPRAYRAVGNILNKNYDPAIPCHRVIRSDGKAGGYNRGQKQKIALLKKEGALNGSIGYRIFLLGLKTRFLTATVAHPLTGRRRKAY